LSTETGFLNLKTAKNFILKLKAETRFLKVFINTFFLCFFISDCFLLLVILSTEIVFFEFKNREKLRFKTEHPNGGCFLLKKGYKYLTGSN